MSIISVIDNENKRWKRNTHTHTNTHTYTHTNTQTNKQTKKTKKNKWDGSYSERVRAKWFCYAFKLGSLQVICKASMIFKSNLELALSIILKERALCE